MLLWELRLQREQKSIESCLAKGRVPPKWYTEKPEHSTLEVFYIACFWELSSERQLGGSTVGPIPRSKIADSAFEWSGLERDMIEPFIQIIQILDGGYRQHLGDEYRKEIARSKTEAKSAAARGRSRGSSKKARRS